MGCRSSKPTGDSTHGSYSHNTAPTRKSSTETKINQALLKKKMEHAIQDKPISFEKILLKFDKMRIVLGYVKTVFNQVATEGKLDHDGLQMAMKRLDVDMNLEDTLDLFDFIDVQETNVVSIKEFLVALTIGMVLDVIPALSTAPHPPPPVETSAKSALRRSFSGLMGHSGEISEVLNLIVSAYLIFDPEGKGFIEKKGIESMLEEHGHKAGGNAMLSQQRWNEMVSMLLVFFNNVSHFVPTQDWDANGTIDFAEFVYAFTSWVDIDEEDG